MRPLYYNDNESRRTSKNSNRAESMRGDLGSTCIAAVLHSHGRATCGPHQGQREFRKRSAFWVSVFRTIFVIECSQKFDYDHQVEPYLPKVSLQDRSPWSSRENLCAESLTSVCIPGKLVSRGTASEALSHIEHIICPCMPSSLHLDASCCCTYQ